MTHSYAFTVALGCVIALCIRHAIINHNRRCTDAEIGQSHGCRSPPRLPNQRLFGIDRLEQIFRANAESPLMQLFLFHFRLWGTTLEQVLLGTRALATIDPAEPRGYPEYELQRSACLAYVYVQHPDDDGNWSMGQRRRIMFPLLGNGIFTQEDVAWKHSRELLRPQFLHKNYEDLEIFREAVDTFIDVVPKEGVVDLKPFFFRLTLDVTTAFLFGESVNSLKTPESISEATFADAFNIAQDFIAKRMRLQSLYWLFSGSKFTKACDDVHRFTDNIIDRNLSRKLDSEKEQSIYVFLDTVAKNCQDRTASAANNS